MSRLSNMVQRWSETINVEIAGAMNRANQCTYTDSTIQGRLVQTEEEVLLYNNNLQDRKMGTKVIAKAKLFSQEELNIADKVEGYQIISKKECKNNKNEIEFYKYFLM